MTANEFFELEKSSFPRRELGTPLSLSQCEKIIADKNYIILENRTHPISHPTAHPIADGVLIGVCVLFISDTTADIISVAVHPDLRRQGVAKKLLTAAFATAKSHGADKIMLEVSAKNTPAIALYKSLKFTQISVRKNYYNGADALILALNL